MVVITPDRRKSKTLILSMNVDRKLLVTKFLIAIYRLGDKWQSKTLFLAILLCLCQLLRAFLIATYPVWSFMVVITSDRRQSKILMLSTKVDQKSLEIEFFYCHLSPNWRQMTIKYTFSSDFWSAFIDCF